MKRISWRIQLLIGIFCFILPIFLVLLGIKLDHSSIRTHELYQKLIPPVMFSGLALAFLVPSLFILSQALSLLKKGLLCLGYWILLGVEIFILMLMTLNRH